MRAATRWRWLCAVLLCALVWGCTPAARSEVPREARGSEVNAQRLRAVASADDALRRATNSAPLQANLDGCQDLRERHIGYWWRCSVIRATTVVGQDVAGTLSEQHQRLVTMGCSAYPGLETTKQRLSQGLTPRYLYDVEYRCPDQVVIAIRFTEPTDPEMASKLDLAGVRNSPGSTDLISGQGFSQNTQNVLAADRSQKVIMMVAAQKAYWLMPAA